MVVSVSDTAYNEESHSDMSTWEAIKTAESGKIARMTLARPPLNVLNIAMITEMNQYVESLSGRTDLCVLVIDAEGEHFCAGVDVPEHKAETVGSMLSTFHELFRLLHRLSFPVVCGARGGTYGGGMELACFCDVIIAADDIKIGVPEITLGVFPPVAIAQLAGLVGTAKAAELIFTGSVVNAQEALRIGLVSRVCPTGELAEVVDKTAGRLARQSAFALRHARAAFRQAAMPQFESALAEAESTYLKELMAGADPVEGLAAFMEKRKPQWKDA
jgi:cyclohexa-1,5-dienecarbonyl-CoA hydratase